MANQQNVTNAEENVNLSKTDLAGLIAAAIKAAREPIVDEAKEASLARNKERMRTQLAESAASVVAAQNNCSHLREDNTSRVAWAENFVASRKLFVKEGFCMACGKHYKPGVEGYAEALRIPTGRQGLIRG
jgi:hypothetical protein